MKVTEQAQEQLSSVVQEERQKREAANLALRIYIQGRCGCGAAHFGMSLEEQPEEADTIVQTGPVFILLDPEAAEVLQEAELGYVEEVMHRGFTLTGLPKNASCSCGGH